MIATTHLPGAAKEEEEEEPNFNLSF